MGAATTSQPALRCTKIRVRADRVELTVQVNPAHRYVTPALIARCVADHPTLPHHTCRNNVGPTFAAVMEETSLPHLLEHVIIDLQTHTTQSKHAVFVGSTQWRRDSSNEALVSVSFLDDLVALKAISQALAYLNQAVVDSNKPA